MDEQNNATNGETPQSPQPPQDEQKQDGSNNLGWEDFTVSPGQYEVPQAPDVIGSDEVKIIPAEKDPDPQDYEGTFDVSDKE